MSHEEKTKIMLEFYNKHNLNKWFVHKETGEMHKIYKIIRLIEVDKYIFSISTEDDKSNHKHSCALPVFLSKYEVIKWEEFTENS